MRVLLSSFLIFNLLFLTTAIDLDDEGESQEGELNPLFRLLGYSLEEIWEILLNVHQNPQKATIVQVGLDDNKLITSSTKLGFKTHVFEPSPVCIDSFQKLQLTDEFAKKKLILHNFTLNHDTKPVPYPILKSCSTDEYRQVVTASDFSNKMHNVSGRRLDRVLKEQLGIDHIFILRIGTHHNHMFILEGFAEYLLDFKALFVLIEFWPAGLADNSGNPLELLELFTNNGYALYDLGCYQSSGACPDSEGTEERPAKFKENVEWFHDYTARTGDRVGRWTNLLAVPALHLRESRLSQVFFDVMSQ